MLALGYLLLTGVCEDLYYKLDLHVFICMYLYACIVCFYYPTTPVGGEYRESIREGNIFFILPSRKMCIDYFEEIALHTQKLTLKIWYQSWIFKIKNTSSSSMWIHYTSIWRWSSLVYCRVWIMIFFVSFQPRVIFLSKLLCDNKVILAIRSVLTLYTCEK